PARMTAENRVVLLVPDLGPATAEALGYIRSFRPHEIRAVHLSRSSELPPDLLDQWREFSRGMPPLESLPAESGDLSDRVKRLVREVPRGGNDFVTGVLPESIGRASLGDLLRRVGLVRLKSWLPRDAGVVVT